MPETIAKYIFITDEYRDHLSRMGYIRALEKKTLSSVGDLTLTSRHLEELTNVSYGLTAGQSGAQMYLSEAAIKERRKNILKAMHVSSMVLAVRIALDRRAIPVEQAGSPLSEALTDAETEVMRAGSIGLSSQETADFLGKSLYTVNRQRDKGFDKLTASNMSHAVRRMYEFGILLPGVVKPPAEAIVASLPSLRNLETTAAAV